MKIFVLGAAGKQAPGVIRDLADSPEITEIVLGDLENTKETLEYRAKHWGNKKAKVVLVNVNDQNGLRKAIRGSVSLANCTTYHFNLLVMEACLAEGTHYVDMGGLFHNSRKQMALSEQWKRRSLTAVLGMGSAPGIVNVMSRYGADLLDMVESIQIRDGIVNFAKLDTPMATPYAFVTILDEFIMNPYIFEKGDWREVQPFTGEELIDFPPPVGTQTAFCTLHSEEATIPATFRSKGLQSMSFKLALPKAFEEKVRFLVDLGLGSSEPLHVKGTPVVPRDLLLEVVDRLPKPTVKPDDHKVLRVDVKGQKDGHTLEIRVEMICHPFEPWEMGTGPYSVGFPVGLTCRLLGNGTITERGALPAEACVPPEPFFKGLAARGLHTTVMIKKSVIDA